MANYLLDNFTGTPGAALESRAADLGGTPTVASGGSSIVIDSTGLRATASNGAFGVYLYPTVPGSVEHDIEVEAADLNTGFNNWFGVLFRSTAATTYFAGYNAGTFKWGIFKFVYNVSVTELNAKLVTAAMNLTSPVAFRVECRDAYKALYLRYGDATRPWQRVAYTTNNDYTGLEAGGNKAGLFMGGTYGDATGLHLDRFRVTSAAAITATGHNPTAQLFAESDTTLGPLDASDELTKTPGVDGPVATSFRAPVAGDYPGVVAATGKYLPGFRLAASGKEPLWWLVEGMFGEDQWSLNYWHTFDNDWSASSALFPISIGNPDYTGGFRIRIENGVVQVTATNFQQYPGVTVVRSTAVTATGGTPANLEWTYAGGEFTLAIDGTVVLFNEGRLLIPPLLAMDGLGGVEGFTLFNVANANDHTISDIRVSRYARYPGVVPALPAPTVAVDLNTVTGALNRNLPGSVNWPGPLDAAYAARRLRVGEGTKTARLGGKHLAGTPIKAGAPDGTHPTLGASGNWSYDWRPVDNEAANVLAAGVTEVYLSLGSTPQILGGSSPPLSGGNLTNAFPTSSAPWNAEPPSSNASYVELTLDLLDRQINHNGLTITRVGLWNEPAGFWSGTDLQLWQLLALMIPAIQAAFPSLEIYIGEVSGIENNADNLSGMIDYLDGQGVTFDGVAYHGYSGKLASWAYADNRVRTYAAATGYVGTIKLIDGEAYWSNYGYPWTELHYTEGDWQAAWRALDLITNHGHIAYSCLFATLNLATGSLGDGPRGPFEGGVIYDTFVGVNHNVHKCYQGLGDDVVSVSTDKPWPGVRLLATKDGDGNARILIGRLRYLKDGDLNLTLTGLPPGAVATRYLVDDGHSNYLQAGAPHEELETAAPLTVAGDGSLVVPLGPRSVSLLEFAPVSATAGAGTPYYGFSPARGFGYFGLGY